MTDRARIALVTGGSRGIGASTATTLAAQGWDVAVSYRERADVAEDVADACRQLGRRAVAVRADMASEDDIVELFARIDRDLGAVTGLVNNAGIVSPAAQVVDYSLSRIQQVLTVNVVGAFLAAREALRRMAISRGGNGGVIVNVSSRAAGLGGSGEYVDYAASKAAIDAMTIGLAKEVAADGVRVAGVSPGLISTDIHAPGRLERLGSSPPLGRPGEPQEVANAIAWLMSDQASYVTGTTLEVSGGR